MEQERLFRPGVYYVALTDLCGATAASAKLGVDLNKRRVESFITLTVESLGSSGPTSYAHLLKVVGDAGLFLFSSFPDLHAWWTRTQSLMAFYSYEWSKRLDADKGAMFQLRSKTVFHVGEVVYSNGTDPVSAAVNQVFKIEKLFRPGELGSTDLAMSIASPFFPDLDLVPEEREEISLPGLTGNQMTWLIAKNLMSDSD